MNLRKKNKNIIFEQDRASTNTSKSNKKLLDSLFRAKGWMLFPPNPPDLAYPIENLWALLKKNLKNRNPKTYDDLKKIFIEEWNKISPRPYFKNYLKRIDKCIEIQGNRLEDYHLNQIRK